MNEIKPQWAFLTSTRFWALVLAAVAIYLQQKGILGTEEMQLIASITGGFTIIRTVDRTGDKKVEAAEIAAE